MALLSIVKQRLPFSRRLGLLVLLAGSVFTGPAAAQQAKTPFQTLTLHAGATLNVNRETLHQYWQPGAGVALSLQTPFYLGVLELSSGFHHYGAAQENLDAFNAVPLALGWGPRIMLTPRLHLSLLGRVGNYLMFFKHLPPSRSQESELMLGVRAQLSYRVAGPWSLTFTGSYHRVFTHVRIDLWYVTLGVSRQLRTPGWLKTFLK